MLQSAKVYQPRKLTRFCFDFDYMLYVSAAKQ